MWKSEISFMSGCFKVDENLNFGDLFHMFELFTDYSNAFWYYFSFLFTYCTLFEIIVFIYWLHPLIVLINYSSLISVVNSYSLSLLGIIATSFFIHILSSSVDLADEILSKAWATSTFGLEFFSLIC